MAEKPREQQELVSGRPDIRLMLGDPVGLGLGAKVIHRGLGANQLEQPAPGPLDPALRLALALVEPKDGRPQRLALGIDIDQRAALGGQGHATDQTAIDAGLRPQLLAGLPSLRQ